MNQSILTRPLGLFGWDKLEPVLLAALINEQPMLLIGKHGTAKSYILERLAEELNLEYRNYNASLINYDDLVGIPYPSEDKSSLKYISSKTSIWDAEVVFIDEINRTKPELQNKLFPIIYEKRVQGEDLTKLKYRWSAMNPSNDDSYSGTFALDSALADRYPFIIKVPEWSELSDEDQHLILGDIYSGKSHLKISLNDLIKEGKNTYLQVVQNNAKFVENFTFILMRLLQSQIGYISARRATYIVDNILSVHAARICLNKLSENKEEIGLKESIVLAVENSLTSNVDDGLSEAKIKCTVLEALKLNLEENNAFQRYILTQNPVEKVKFGIKHLNELPKEEFYVSLPRVLSNMELVDKKAMALVLYLRLRNDLELPTAVMETLAGLTYEILTSNAYITAGENADLAKNKLLKKIANVNLGSEELNIYYQNIMKYYITKHKKYTVEKLEELGEKFIALYHSIVEDK